MKSYWIRFQDGSVGSCQGESPTDAQRIAETVSGKKIDKPNSWSVDSKNVQELPYLAAPVIWQFDHPSYGKSPAFCYAPNTCAGHTSCPRARSCTE